MLVMNFSIAKTLSLLLLLACVAIPQEVEPPKPDSRAERCAAIIADFKKLADRFRETGTSLERNTRDFEQAEIELRHTLDAATAERLTRSTTSALRQASQFDPETGLPREQNFTTDQLRNRELEATLRIEQLSIAQQALVRKQLSCIEEADRLSALRREISSQAPQYLDKLWEFADVAKRFDEVTNREVLKKFDSIDNEDQASVVVRGLLNQRLGDEEQAEEDFTKLIERNGWAKAIAHAARGRLYTRQGKAKKAREDISTAKKLADKDDLFVSWITALRLAQQQEWKAAESSLRLAIKSEKHEAELRCHLALVLFEQCKQRTSLSKECLEQAQLASLLTSEKDWLCETAYALAQSTSGDLANAKQRLEKAIELAPEDRRWVCEAIAKQLEANEASTAELW
jgi:tetratricopeptide (TPR) repeat protein